MRMPRLDEDGWELRSAELAHQQNPDTFRIPPLQARQSLRRGQAARLISDIESEDENGGRTIQGERMNVIVTGRFENAYIGLLDDKPASFNPVGNVYLCFGAEIPFLSEHVIDILQPPAEYVEWQLSQEPERRWPRQ